MRSAEPDELKEYALPVMTAQLSEAELVAWLPIAFEEITDPWATPEPSKGALGKLDSGEYFVVYFGEDSEQLTVRIPAGVDANTFLTSFFREVPLPRARVLWHRPDAHLPGPELVSPLLAPSLPAYRFWSVQADPDSQVESMHLTPQQKWTLSLLVVKLSYCAGDIAPMNESGLRAIQMPYTILTEDGAELAPLAVYYILSEDGKTALITDVKAVSSRDTMLTSASLVGTVVNDHALPMAA